MSFDPENIERWVTDDSGPGVYPVSLGNRGDCKYVEAEDYDKLLQIYRNQVALIEGGTIYANFEEGTIYFKPQQIS